MTNAVLNLAVLPSDIIRKIFDIDLKNIDDLRTVRYNFILSARIVMLFPEEEPSLSSFLLVNKEAR